MRDSSSVPILIPLDQTFLSLFAPRNDRSWRRWQVGRENPAELKAQKLARSVVRGVLDRDARPDTQERARITAVLQLPPNRCVWFESALATADWDSILSDGFVL